MDKKEWTGKSPSILVIGCGNRLFGDDGIGSIVAEHFLAHYPLNEDVEVLDAGTGIRKILFDVALGRYTPRKIIIIDAIDLGKPPGEIIEVDIEKIPERTARNLSFHQVPTFSLLKEIQKFRSIEIRVIAIQVSSIPDSVNPEVSEEVSSSIKAACEKILAIKHGG